MTDDQRDAAIGRTVTEYRDKKNRLAALRSDLTRTAGALGALAEGLRSAPHLLDFGGESFPISELGQTKKVDAVDLAALRAQLRDYRELRQQVEALAGQIKEFGLNP